MSYLNKLTLLKLLMTVAIWYCFQFHFTAIQLHMILL